MHGIIWGMPGMLVLHTPFPIPRDDLSIIFKRWFRCIKAIK